MKTEIKGLLAALTSDVVASNREALIRGDNEAVLHTPMLEHPENSAPVSPEAGRIPRGFRVGRLRRHRVR